MKASTFRETGIPVTTPKGEKALFQYGKKGVDQELTSTLEPGNSLLVLI